VAGSGKWKGGYFGFTLLLTSFRLIFPRKGGILLRFKKKKVFNTYFLNIKFKENYKSDNYRDHLFNSYTLQNASLNYLRELHMKICHLDHLVSRAVKVSGASPVILAQYSQIR
jgi:hypothetical protein